VYVHVDTTIHDVSIPFLQVWRLKRCLDFKLMYCVYVAVSPNKDTPYIKIGYSRDSHKREQQLSSYGLEKWKIVYKYEYNSENESKCMENQLLRAFTARNCKNFYNCSSREMFLASPHHVNEVVTTRGLKPKDRCCRNRWSCNCNGYGGSGRVSFELPENIIKEKYDDWVISNYKYKNNDKHLIELMEVMDDIAPNISDGQYLKATNILKNMY